MKASYTYTVLNPIQDGEHAGGFYPTNVVMIAESETEARNKAIAMIGSGTLVKPAALAHELKLISVVDIEASKQRYMHSNDGPDWMREN